MDNFYTNLALFRALLDKRMPVEQLEGTVVNFLNGSNIKTKCRRCDLYSKWRYFGCSLEGQKNVFVLSSFYGNFAKGIGRYSGNVVKPVVKCCISEYNQHMGGVDICDQLLSYYAISKNSINWWKNSEFGRKRNSHKRYREMLIHELVQSLLYKRNDDEPPTNMGRPSEPKKRSRINVQDDIRLRGRHYATKKHPKRKCTMCGCKKNKATGKRTNKHTLNYYEKCQ